MVMLMKFIMKGLIFVGSLFFSMSVNIIRVVKEKIIMIGV